MNLAAIETRHLAAFLAVYEHRSFAKAAASLGYAQPTISQQLAALERTVGTSLFERPGGPRPVIPTHAGHALAPHARGVFAHLADARAEMEDIRHAERSTLRIATFESVATSLLPAIVARLANEFPHADIDFVEPVDCSVTGLVADGRVDIAIDVAEPNGNAFESQAILVDPFVAVCPAGHDPDPIAAADLVEHPLIGHHDADPCQATVNTALAGFGVPPSYAFRSGDNGTLQAMARAGVGVAIMARLAVDAADPDVVIRQIEPEIGPRVITIVWRHGQSPTPLARRFVALAATVADQLVAADNSPHGLRVLAAPSQR